MGAYRICLWEIVDFAEGEVRDRAGYSRALRDICGDVGIVGCADALGFAERVAGIERSRKKIRKKHNAEALSTLRRAEKRVGAKKNERKEKRTDVPARSG